MQGQFEQTIILYCQDPNRDSIKTKLKLLGVKREIMLAQNPKEYDNAIKDYENFITDSNDQFKLGFVIITPSSTSTALRKNITSKFVFKRLFLLGDKQICLKSVKIGELENGVIIHRKVERQLLIAMKMVAQSLKNDKETSIYWKKQTFPFNSVSVKKAANIPPAISQPQTPQISYKLPVDQTVTKRLEKIMSPTMQALFNKSKQSQLNATVIHQNQISKISDPKVNQTMINLGGPSSDLSNESIHILPQLEKAQIKKSKQIPKMQKTNNVLQVQIKASSSQKIAKSQLPEQKVVIKKEASIENIVQEKILEEIEKQMKIKQDKNQQKQEEIEIEQNNREQKQDINNLQGSFYNYSKPTEEKTEETIPSRSANEIKIENVKVQQKEIDKIKQVQVVRLVAHQEEKCVEKLQVQPQDNKQEQPLSRSASYMKEQTKQSLEECQTKQDKKQTKTRRKLRIIQRNSEETRQNYKKLWNRVRNNGQEKQNNYNSALEVLKAREYQKFIKNQQNQKENIIYGVQNKEQIPKYKSVEIIWVDPNNTNDSITSSLKKKLKEKVKIESTKVFSNQICERILQNKTIQFVFILTNQTFYEILTSCYYPFANCQKFIVYCMNEGIAQGNKFKFSPSENVTVTTDPHQCERVILDYVEREYYKIKQEWI